jgi:hypothetical protein
MILDNTLGKRNCREESMTGVIDFNKLDSSEKSLKTVLDADIHEDNKASRVLSAMAFLTAASAAIFSKVYSPGSAYGDIQQKLTQALTPYLSQSNLTIIDQLARTLQKPQLTIFGIDWALISFAAVMTFILVGASLYLAALGPSLNIPDYFEHHGDNNEPKSLLFFGVISKLNKTNWDTYWKEHDNDSLRSSMANNNVNETYLIAQKVQSKVDYMSWGSAFFKLAILSISLLTADIFSPNIDLARVFIIISTILISISFVYETITRQPRKLSAILVKIAILVIIIAAVIISLILLKLS